MSHKLAKQARANAPTQQPQHLARPQRGALIAASQQFEGPVPPPDMIEAYERVLPGMAERILAMAEKEQSHRHQQETDKLTKETRSDRRIAKLYLIGQGFGFILGMSGVIGGIILSYQGKNIAGFGFFFTSLAALIGVFLVQKKRNETSDKKAAGDQSQPGDDQ